MINPKPLSLIRNARCESSHGSPNEKGMLSTQAPLFNPDHTDKTSLDGAQVRRLLDDV
jgi:hypothetical protein